MNSGLDKQLCSDLHSNLSCTLVGKKNFLENEDRNLPATTSASKVGVLARPRCVTTNNYNYNSYFSLIPFRKNFGVLLFSHQLSKIVQTYSLCSLQSANNIFLSYQTSTRQQPPASQQYFSLTINQHQLSATAQRTEAL